MISPDEVVDAVLEDVVDRLVEEHGIEIAALDWRIFEDVRESVQVKKPKFTPAEHKKFSALYKKHLHNASERGMDDGDYAQKYFDLDAKHKRFAEWHDHHHSANWKK